MDEATVLYGPTEELPNCTLEGVSSAWLKPKEGEVEEPTAEVIPEVTASPAILKAVYV